MQYNEVVESLMPELAFENYGRLSVTDDSLHASLSATSISALFPDGYQDAQMAACCLAGLWLLNNFLDEGHEICQDIETSAGSHWHAIMHRAEGDFSNAKYWYRRAQTPTITNAIAEQSGSDFDPNALVDAVARGDRDDVHRLLIAEWKGLFDYCYRNAI